MEFRWVISQGNGKPYSDFVERHKSHSIVKKRIDRNLKHIDVAISKGRFWRVLVGCLLTTQQRSGPSSRVTIFLNAAVLTALGMIMLPPQLVSLPLKLLLFVTVDGWHLLVGSLIGSF